MMNFNRYILITAIFATLFSAVGCKQDDDSETNLLTFNGILTLTMGGTYDFVAAGDTIKAVPSGVSLPDGGDFGYCWTITGAATKTDTTRHIGDPATANGAIEFIAPDTTGVLAFTCNAFATGYYNATVSFNSSIIDKEKSLSGRTFSDKCKTYEDKRTGKIYHYEQIDTVEWFCENLIYKIEENRGVPFAGCKVMEDLFGSYYSWSDAMTACPAEDGWRLPSENDWVDLANTVSSEVYSKYQDFNGPSVHVISNAEFNSKKMWDYWPTHLPSGKTSLNFLPTGYAAIEDSAYSFYDAMSKDFDFFYCSFWSADEYDEHRSYYRYIYNGKYPIIYCAFTSKNAVAMPVRCVRTAKDSPEVSN